MSSSNHSYILRQSLVDPQELTKEALEMEDADEFFVAVDKILLHGTDKYSLPPDALEDFLKRMGKSERDFDPADADIEEPDPETLIKLLKGKK